MDIPADLAEAFTQRAYFYDTRAEPLLLRPLSPRLAVRRRKALQRVHRHDFAHNTQRCACGWQLWWDEDRRTWHSRGVWREARGRMPLRPHAGRGVTERSKLMRKLPVLRIPVLAPNVWSLVQPCPVCGATDPMLHLLNEHLKAGK